jgi:hypothetical protein
MAPPPTRQVEVSLKARTVERDSDLNGERSLSRHIVWPPA